MAKKIKSKNVSWHWSLVIAGVLLADAKVLVRAKPPVRLTNVHRFDPCRRIS